MALLHSDGWLHCMLQGWYLYIGLAFGPCFAAVHVLPGLRVAVCVHTKLS